MSFSLRCGADGRRSISFVSSYFQRTNLNQLRSCLYICLNLSGYLCGISMYNMVDHLQCQQSFPFQYVRSSNTGL